MMSSETASHFRHHALELQRRCAVEIDRETVAREHQPDGECTAGAALPGCARQALMVCCRPAENE
jgi:hypothetical protein